jgi:hypothetical protein
METGLQSVATAKSMYAYRISYEVLARQTLVDFQNQVKAVLRSDVYSKMPTSSEEINEQFGKCVAATSEPVFAFGAKAWQEASASLAEVCTSCFFSHGQCAAVFVPLPCECMAFVSS